MRKLAKAPSPAMAVAVAALVVSIAGTAVAGVATVSVLTKKEKKSVRKIADKRIKAMAQGLSVRFATEAGNAANQEWAVVSGGGTLVRSTPGITGAERLAGGQYDVDTNRDLSGCYFVATLGGDTPDEGLRGDISVNRLDGTTDRIYVLTSQEAPPQNADRPFTLLIRC